VRRTFTVNVRTPRLTSGGSVRLKSREQGVLHWDDKLTLEFNGSRPAIRGIEVTRADDAVTVFLLGDSTVTDQPLEPWNSWGQMLPRFFSAGVAVANHAESGESLRSSLSARRVEKVLQSLKAGDHVFVQFGHNDQKEKGEDVGAFTTYLAGLKQLVADVRKRGGVPVLVTSMERKAGVEKDTLGDYPEAVRRAAREEGVALIDLNAMSRVLYRALGTDLDKAFQDGTHHNAYGSYKLARCVVEGIRQNQLTIARFLAADTPVFNPGRPDSVSEFRVPPSLPGTTVKPDGN
jgi:lysophospholipase L1-like esterase